jgi:CBS domain-containing protein
LALRDNVAAMADSNSPDKPDEDGSRQWAYGPKDEDSWGTNRDLAGEVARYKAEQLEEVEAVDAEPAVPPGPPPKKAREKGTGSPSTLPPPRSLRRPELTRSHAVQLPYREFPPKVVSDTMTRKLIAIGEDESLQAIEDGMKKYEVRQFPVVDKDNKLIGMVSWDDVLLASSSSLSAEREARDKLIHAAARAKDVMDRDVATVRPDDVIMDAADVMQLKRLRCLPVTDEQGTLVGILTVNDFMQLAINFLATR